MQDADRRRRAAFLLGRAYARRERLRDRRDIADIDCELADLQDHVAEVEAIEMSHGRER